ncbi:hypothetical protein GC176_17095 [bacterium]|nr:hypothetical protein [bacterium]
MDTQLLLDTISRVVHVGTVIILAGGSFFMWRVLLPSAAELPDAEHDRLRAAVTGRWKKFVHAGIALILISGFYNFARLVPAHKGDSLYHALLGTKIMLAFGVFFLGSALVGKSKAFEPLRQNRGRWLAILVALLAVIVAISGFVKVRGKYVPPMTPVAELSADAD